MAGRSRAQVVGSYVAFWIIGLCWPIVAGAGWVIEQVEYANPGSEGTKTVQYISKQRLKTVGEGNTFIMDFPKNLFIATDEENRVYWSGTVDEYVREVQTFQQAAHELARQQLEAALKEMPPEQRKAMEDILQHMRGMPSPSGATTAAQRPQVQIEPTADTGTMVGHKVNRVMVYADGKPYQEVWLAKDVALKGELDLKRMRRLQAKLTQAVMAELPSRQAVEEDPAYEAMLERGYPLKIVELGEQGEPEAITEVVRLEKREIPDKEFQVPEGYRRIDLRELFKEELDKLRRGE
ncbi:MAG TPA: DUF4412 domain-containing protein [Alphaproteobacteria bacterium]|nr:DUF4412 domain-containing protein [Alphaproteobacteria bacterium]